MQLSHLLALATTATAAARVSDRSSSSSRFPRWRLPVRREEQHPPAYGQPLCWAGEIHHPCGGFASGCTPDGILVSSLFVFFFLAVPKRYPLHLEE